MLKVALIALFVPVACHYKVFLHGSLDRRAVVRILERVVKVRKLRPKRPIRLKVITVAQLKREIRDDLRQYATSGKLERRQKSLRALHLIGPDTELGEAYRSLLGELPLGYYDSQKRKLRLIHRPFMRSEIMELIGFFRQRDPVYGELLAHELTHALVDQHFDLTGFLEADTTEDGQLARKALAEGDATLTGFLCGNLLFGRFKVFVGFMRRTLRTERSFARAPSFLKGTFSFPYTHGGLFAAALWRRGGPRLIDRAYRHPPRSTEQILHPEKYLSKKPDVPRPVPPLAVKQALGEGFKALYISPLGEYIIRLQLARLSPPRIAARAAAGWGGDRAQVWEHKKSGRLVVIWQTVWDTERDAREFYVEAEKLLVRSASQEGEHRPWRVRRTRHGVRLRTRAGIWAVSREGATVLYLERLPAGAYRRLFTPAPRPRPRRAPPPPARPPRKKERKAP